MIPSCYTMIPTQWANPLWLDRGPPSDRWVTLLAPALHAGCAVLGNTGHAWTRSEALTSDCSPPPALPLSQGLVSLSTPVSSLSCGARAKG